ncbi:MAG TPA: winged helix-turn-helix transcriptional regulator [Thermodesulfovibrionales bacterium]|jgi:DNA-binding MarR family transcriptional regulator|nr:winged helix-turn-helix transcriptional regulator [Thermodesulfovibrionales bacterium]
MNMKAGREDGEPLKSLQLLDELANNGSMTQRDLSKRLGIALGLVNSYIKNLVAKGYVTVRMIPPKRYTYYLTPKGFKEKTRLAYDLMQDYTRIYRETRTNLKELFGEMQGSGAREVVFAGADEIAEIAYLTLQETKLKLQGVVGEELSGASFFGREIKPMDAVGGMEYDFVLVASYLRRNEIFQGLLRNGVKREEIKVIFPL